MLIDDDFSVNPFGISNDTMKKSGFRFANGLAKIDSELSVSGFAKVVARLLRVVEVTAEIEANINGRLALSAGRQGQLLPVNTWLSNMKTLTAPENAGFASAQISFDGSFDASVALTEPLPVSGGEFQGRFAEPFEVDLLGDTSNRAPNITYDIDLPGLGVSAS